MFWSRKPATDDRPRCPWCRSRLDPVEVIPIDHGSRKAAEEADWICLNCSPSRYFVTKPRIAKPEPLDDGEFGPLRAIG